MAIIDPELTAGMPSSLAADSGFDALTHATEAYVSVYANDFTDGMALHAIRLIFDNLEQSVTGEPGTPATTRAREKMHNAGTIAGMAFGNAFLGIVHAMAHTIGATFHLVHGRTNATLLPAVIRYNGSIPTKLNAWPKYEHYVAPERLAEIAAMLGLPAASPEEGVESYARAVEDLRARVGIPSSFAAQGVSEADFIGRLDELAMGAYHDQCAPANPRMPMLADMKELMVAATTASDRTRTAKDRRWWRRSPTQRDLRLMPRSAAAAIRSKYLNPPERPLMSTVTQTTPTGVEPTPRLFRPPGRVSPPVRGRTRSTSGTSSSATTPRTSVTPASWPVRPSAPPPCGSG